MVVRKMRKPAKAIQREASIGKGMRVGLLRFERG
jgi:hypothetical protein